MQTGIDERIRQLERASEEVRQTLQIPGMEGQTRLFAKLEDVQEAMEDVRRAIGSASAGGGVAGPATPPLVGGSSPLGAGAHPLGAEDRRRALAAIEACREQLRQTEKIFAFVARMLAEGASEGGGTGYEGGLVYGDQRQGLRLRGSSGSPGAMQWEG